MDEIWKEIKNYEGLYQVSNKGIVKSLERSVIQTVNGRQVSRIRKERILKPNADKDDYLYVSLSKNGIKKTLFIHRLVALSFIPNIDKFPAVNHKDENKQNNNAENLEWCTIQYNSSYGTVKERLSDKFKNRNDLSIPIIQETKYGLFVAEYSSIKEAERITGVNHTHISACCKNKAKSAGGFIWSYK